MKNKILLISLALILVTSLAAASCAAPAPAPAPSPKPAPAPKPAPVILKASHQWPEGDIRDSWIRNFTSLVETRTGGSVKFTLYPGGVLYKARDQIDAIRIGALDLAVWPLGYSAGTFPLLALSDLPGLIPNTEKGARFAEAEVGKRLKEIAERDAGFKILSWGFIPTAIGTKGRLVKVPSDLEGLIMRSPIKSVAMVFEQGGATVVSISSKEVYMALQTGVLDGAFTTSSTFLSGRLYEVLDYLTIGEYSLMPGSFAIVISPAVFEKLTGDQQRILIEAGDESARGFLNTVNEITAKTERVFRENGVETYAMSSEEYAVWIEVAQKTSWKWFREEIEGGSELLDLALKVK